MGGGGRGGGANDVAAAADDDGAGAHYGMQFRHFLAFASDYRLCPELCPQITLWQQWLVSSQTQHKQFQLSAVDGNGDDDDAFADGGDGHGTWYSFTNFGIALANVAQRCFPRGTVAQRLNMLLELVQHGFQRQVRPAATVRASTRPSRHRLQQQQSHPQLQRRDFAHGTTTTTANGGGVVVVSQRDTARAQRQRSMTSFEVLLHPEVVAFLNPKRFSGGNIVGGDGGARLRMLFREFASKYSGHAGRRDHGADYDDDDDDQSSATMNAVAWMELIEAAGLLGAGHGRVTRTEALGVFNVTVAAAQAVSSSARSVESMDAATAEASAQQHPRRRGGLSLHMFAEAMTRVAMIGIDDGGDDSSRSPKDDDTTARQVVEVLQGAVDTAFRGR